MNTKKQNLCIKKVLWNVKIVQTFVNEETLTNGSILLTSQIEADIMRTVTENSVRIKVAHYVTIIKY